MEITKLLYIVTLRDTRKQEKLVVDYLNASWNDIQLVQVNFHNLPASIINTSLMRDESQKN